MPEPFNRIPLFRVCELLFKALPDLSADVFAKRIANGVHGPWRKLFFEDDARRQSAKADDTHGAKLPGGKLLRRHESHSRRWHQPNEGNIIVPLAQEYLDGKLRFARHLGGTVQICLRLHGEAPFLSSSGKNLTGFPSPVPRITRFGYFDFESTQPV